MKKRILLFSLFAVLLSCNDATEIIQKGELNDAALFVSVDNMQNFLNETYDRVSTQTDIQVASLLTDEVAIGNSLTTNDTQRFFIVTTNGPAAALWNTHYNAINYTNRLIAGAKLYSPSASELPRYNSIIAQARALRAFCHFQLMVYFSTDLSSDAALGVMLVDKVPTPNEDIPRATNGDLFKFINDDLAFAEANLIAPTGAGAYKLVTKNFITAFKARMSLYRKKYTEASAFADDLLANSGRVLSTSTVTIPNFPATSSVIPSLAGSTTINVDPGAANPVQRALFQMDQWVAASSPVYRRMWVDAEQGEILFAIDRPNNRNNFSSVYNTNGSYLTGAPLYDMGRSLFDLYATSLGGGAEDFRRWCFVDRSATPNTASRTNEVIVIDKYPGKAGSHTSNDLKVFRLSEIYFIKAECLVRANNLAGAANLIRQVRQARSYTGGTVPTPTYANAAAALADILLERRKELSFEGHRYIDLKRLGADANVSGTDRSSQDAINSSATNPVNITISDYRFTLPIPQSEININPLIQNAGYN